MNPSTDLHSQFADSETQLQPRVNFRTRRFVLSELLDLLEQGKLRAPLAKRTSSWERFPAALLMGLPQGAVIIDTSEPVWYIIAGGEMLLSLAYFCGVERPRLHGNFLPMPRLMGKSFSELPAAVAARIANWTVDASLLLPRSGLLTRLTCVAQNFRPAEVEKKVLDFISAVRPVESKMMEEFCSFAGVKTQSLMACVFSTAFYEDTVEDVSQDLSLSIGQGLLIDKYERLQAALGRSEEIAPHIRHLESLKCGTVLNLAKTTLLDMCIAKGFTPNEVSVPKLLRVIQRTQLSPLATAKDVREEANRILARW